MLLALASAVGSISACNVIVNPGFEAGLSGWQFTQPGAVSPTGAVVHSGAGALAFTMPNLSGTSIAYQTLAAVGDPVSLSFWIRVDQLGAAKLRVDVSIGGTPFLAVPVLAADQWTFVDLSAQVAPQPVARELRFYAVAVGTGQAGAKVYLDDVNFGVVPSPGAVGVMAGFASVRRRR
jgi:hypothetical protein